MDCLNAIKFLAVLAFVHATNGQTATVSGLPEVAVDNTTSLTCTVNGGSTDKIQWLDVTGGGTVNIYLGTTSLTEAPKYDNFDVTSLSPTESVMTIADAEVEDDGDYRCVLPTDSTGDDINLVVEASSNVTVTLTSIVTDNVDMYVATCDAIGGKPQETITWILNEVIQTDGNGNTIVDTNPTATAPFSNSKSVFTFPATQENKGQTLVCQVSGHDVLTELNGDVSKDLTIHASPSSDTTVTAAYEPYETGITVSCSAQISLQNPPSPAMRNYYIFSNGTLLHEFMNGGNAVTVSAPIEGTEYTCMAGNYLGNTSLSKAVTYDPNRPTIPPPTTALETTTSNGNKTGDGKQTGLPTIQPSTTTNENETGDPSPAGLSGGAYAGIAIGVIACIVIIVVIVLFLLKPECCPCFASGTPPPSNKPSGRAVGSSNGSGSEKEKLPQAAPRGHGSIQHTNDNPDQAMYAMVDKKPARGGGGGDVPDTRGSGPGQNEPQGMLYADLDLSHKAGHTDKHVPKNENDVVVYSSILV